MAATNMTPAKATRSAAHPEDMRRCAGDVTITAAPGMPDQLIRPLALRAMFMRPSYLEKSAWLEHIPFAFWLVEAHQPAVFVELGSLYGASYFAFCQAVERLGLDTRCFAVDTWKGDEHAGFYGEEVYEKVRAHNDAQYSAFSRLVRSTFDEALDHFSDGSIDLLHIDGLHSAEAVRHDFERWLPKLSDRGVVIFHDSNVRERQFGVFTLIEELRQTYPLFEFAHGHGLAVVAVGPHQNDLMKGLFNAVTDDFARRALHEVFGRLGRACADALTVQEQKNRLNALQASARKQTEDIAKLNQTLQTTKGDLDARAKELRETRAKLQAQVEHHAAERGQLSERVSLLQELRTELKEEVGRMSARLDQAAAELKERTEALIKLQVASRQQGGLLDQAQAEAERLENGLKAARADLQAHKELLQSTRTELETEHQAAVTARQALLDEMSQLRARLAEVGAELEAEKRARAAAERAVAEETAAAAEAHQRLMEQQGQTQRADEAARQALLDEMSQLRARLDAVGSELQAATRARVAAEKTLAAQKASAAEAAEQQAQTLRAAEAANETLAIKLQARFDEIAKLTKLLMQAEEFKAQQAAELTACRQRSEAVETDLDACKKQTSHLAGLLAAAAHERTTAAKAFGKAIVTLAGYTPDNPPRAKVLRRLADTLTRSGLLDRDWYLARHKDVAEAGLDPAMHYLLHGLMEGREPSDFSSAGKASVRAD